MYSCLTYFSIAILILTTIHEFRRINLYFFLPIIRENIRPVAKKNWDLSYHSQVLWLWSCWRHSEGRSGKIAIAQKPFNFFSYKFYQGCVFYISCFSFCFCFSCYHWKKINNCFTGLQTFLSRFFSPLINELLGFLKIPMSRSFSVYGICWLLFSSTITSVFY